MTTRNYVPTYPSRYAPRTAGEPARAQQSLAPLPDTPPPVIPASELYGRPARSVRAMIADSRISGPCRITGLDREGRQTGTRIVKPRSPYFAIRLNEEHAALIQKRIGYVPDRFPAALRCGAQPQDAKDPHMRQKLHDLGLILAPKQTPAGTYGMRARAARLLLYGTP